MTHSVAVEGDMVVIDVTGLSAATFSLPQDEARELAQAILDALVSPLTPEALASWADEEVLAAWKASDWTPGEPRADALAAEMERRNLDF